MDHAIHRHRPGRIRGCWRRRSGGLPRPGAGSRPPVTRPAPGCGTAAALRARGRTGSPPGWGCGGTGPRGGPGHSAADHRGTRRAGGTSRCGRGSAAGLMRRERCAVRRPGPDLAGPRRSPTTPCFRRAHHGKPTDGTGLNGTRRHSGYDGGIGLLTGPYAGELGCMIVTRS
jgi:hypothetical protein